MSTKASEAVMNSGLSVTGMHKFTASLEIPPVRARTLKKREREIGVTEKVAEKSCLDGTELEQNLCSLYSSDVNKEVADDLKANYDMGWQGGGRTFNSRSRHGALIGMVLYDMGWQGGGRTFNSRSRHGALIGTESETILSYETRISNCKQCEGNKVTCRMKEYDCGINWRGSSKAMESVSEVDMIVSGATEVSHINKHEWRFNNNGKKNKKSAPHELRH